jgi:hypothetical protein
LRPQTAKQDDRRELFRDDASEASSEHRWPAWPASCHGKGDAVVHGLAESARGGAGRHDVPVRIEQGSESPTFMFETPSVDRNTRLKILPFFARGISVYATVNNYLPPKSCSMFTHHPPPIEKNKGSTRESFGSKGTKIGIQPLRSLGCNLPCKKSFQ